MQDFVDKVRIKPEEVVIQKLLQEQMQILMARAGCDVEALAKHINKPQAHVQKIIECDLSISTEDYLRVYAALGYVATSNDLSSKVLSPLFTF